ncbi:MAG: hypothetical protein Q7V17_08575 [Afipia sp.]|nr:hypothetical protein [Afipia sp.]
MKWLFENRIWKVEMTHAGAISEVVITGLDPVIHHLLKKMDGRVKPGHDEIKAMRTPHIQCRPRAGGDP